MPNYNKKSLRSRMQNRSGKRRTHKRQEQIDNSRVGAERQHTRIVMRASSLFTQGHSRTDLRTMGRDVGLTPAQMGNKDTVSDEELCRLIAAADPK